MTATAAADTRRSKEAGSPRAGFALLVILFMAAAVALSLYCEVPRVRFEARRFRESLLIDRGEQFARAIRVFVRANGRYPRDLGELEQSGGRRWLRRRYTDPLTGAADWRTIAVHGPGLLSDPVQPQATYSTAGIAGVASYAEGRSIKVYRGAERYSDWEFTYDVTADSPVIYPHIARAAVGSADTPPQFLPPFQILNVESSAQTEGLAVPPGAPVDGRSARYEVPSSTHPAGVTPLFSGINAPQSSPPDSPARQH